MHLLTKSIILWLALAVVAAAPAQALVYGPDRNGVYGGMQGVGGLEAVITEGTTTVNGVTNDYFGDALAAPGSTTRFSAVVGGYGAMPGSSAVNSSLQAQWRGEYIDPTGLYYMGARYYEPNSGRFLSADPLGHAASMDLYSFANGDPVNGFDPDGRNSAPGAANVESSPSTNYGQDMIGLAGPSSLQDNSAILQDHLDLLQAEDSVQTTANTLLGLANLATFVAAPEAEPELLSAEVAGGVLPKAAELTGSESPIVAGDMGLGEYGPVAPPAAAGIKVAPPGVAGWTADGSPLLGGVPQSMYNAAAEGGGDALTTVYRVEGTANTRLAIGEGGDVSIQGNNTLFLNFGDEARAQDFLARRIDQGMEGATLKQFQVPSSYVDQLRSSSVLESEVHMFPEAPIRVDTAYPDQFGLRPQHFDELLNNIVPGSGK